MMEAAPRYDILSLIPQRPPFVVVDRLESCDQGSARSSFLVKREHILVEDGELSEAGLVENMAQTAAARVGWLIQGDNKLIHIGYIGDIKNLEIATLPKVNDLLETEILVKNQIFGITVVEGKVKCHDKILASCEMKIFISNKS
jgi:predicted hotdog family 3-hydroxylacyl-ACP dehydratase